MLPDNQYPSENKKRIFPHALIIMLAFLIFLGAFGYLYYFDPTLFNPKENNQNKNSVAQNTIKADSLIGGGY